MAIVSGVPNFTIFTVSILSLFHHPYDALVLADSFPRDSCFSRPASTIVAIRFGTFNL